LQEPHGFGIIDGFTNGAVRVSRVPRPPAGRPPQMTQTITVIRGDGIGPEIMEATLHVLDALDTGLQYEFAEAGLVALEQSGELLPAATMDSIRKNRVALKSPLTTPVGGGFSSINVELRKRFDLY